MQIEHLSGSIGEKLPVEVKALDLVYEKSRKSYTRNWVYVMLVLMAIFAFLPWTQNIQSEGFITTLKQDERPQQLNSQIPGKILKWYVKEGDFVKAGDTILQLGEIKDDYLDPNILPRTQFQLEQNENKAKFYEGKIETVQQQMRNLEEQRTLKMASLENKKQQIDRKIQSKKVEVEAARIDMQQSADQLERAKQMFAKEAISKTELEKRNATYQKAFAAHTDKKIELENLNQDLQLNKLDISNAIQEYAEKIAKARGDEFSNAGAVAEAKEKVAALEIKRQNLQQRAGYYYLVAPQAGQIIRAMKAGINEIVKEGEMIVEVVPDRMSYAVELFIQPVDLPLVEKGQKVRFTFDGFPAIVFSGWPEASYGTYSGVVAAIETNRSANGKFRILVGEDKDDRPWPEGLKIGAGANGFALLKNVPVWYELWRNINGFPPDYYKASAPKSDSKTDKK